MKQFFYSSALLAIYPGLQRPHPEKTTVSPGSIDENIPV